MHLPKPSLFLDARVPPGAEEAMHPSMVSPSPIYRDFNARKDVSPRAFPAFPGIPTSTSEWQRDTLATAMSPCFQLDRQHELHAAAYRASSLCSTTDAGSHTASGSQENGSEISHNQPCFGEQETRRSSAFDIFQPPAPLPLRSGYPSSSQQENIAAAPIPSIFQSEDTASALHLTRRSAHPSPLQLESEAKSPMANLQQSDELSAISKLERLSSERQRLAKEVERDKTRHSELAGLQKLLPEALREGLRTEVQKGVETLRADMERMFAKRDCDMMAAASTSQQKRPEINEIKDAIVELRRNMERSDSSPVLDEIQTLKTMVKTFSTILQSFQESDCNVVVGEMQKLKPEIQKTLVEHRADIERLLQNHVIDRDSKAMRDSADVNSLHKAIDDHMAIVQSRLSQVQKSHQQHQEDAQASFAGIRDAIRGIDVTAVHRSIQDLELASLPQVMQAHADETARQFRKLQSLVEEDKVARQCSNGEDLSHIRAVMQALGSRMQDDVMDISKQIKSLDIGMVYDAIQNQSRVFVDYLKQNAVEVDFTPMLAAIRDNQAETSHAFSKLSETMQQHKLDLDMGPLVRSLESHHSDISDGFSKVVRSLEEHHSDISVGFSKMSASMQQLQMDTDTAPVLRAIQAQGSEMNDRVRDIFEEVRNHVRDRPTDSAEKHVQDLKLGIDVKFEELGKNIHQRLVEMDVPSLHNALRDHSREVFNSFSNVQEVVRYNKQELDMGPFQLALQNHTAEMMTCLAELSSGLARMRSELNLAPLETAMQTQSTNVTNGFYELSATLQRLRSEFDVSSLQSAMQNHNRELVGSISEITSSLQRIRTDLEQALTQDHNASFTSHLAGLHSDIQRIRSDLTQAISNNKTSDMMECLSDLNSNLGRMRTDFDLSCLKDLMHENKREFTNCLSEVNGSVQKVRSQMDQTFARNQIGELMSCFAELNLGIQGMRADLDPSSLRGTLESHHMECAANFLELKTSIHKLKPDVDSTSLLDLMQTQKAEMDSSLAQFLVVLKLVQEQTDNEDNFTRILKAIQMNHVEVDLAPLQRSMREQRSDIDDHFGKLHKTLQQVKAECSLDQFQRALQAQKTDLDTRLPSVIEAVKQSTQEQRVEIEQNFLKLHKAMRENETSLDVGPMRKILSEHSSDITTKFSEVVATTLQQHFQLIRRDLDFAPVFRAIQDNAQLDLSPIQRAIREHSDELQTEISQIQKLIRDNRNEVDLVTLQRTIRESKGDIDITPVVRVLQEKLDLYPLQKSIEQCVKEQMCPIELLGSKLDKVVADCRIGCNS